MPRIVGVDIPKEKKICISLGYIYGIGRSNAMDILKKANVNPDVRAKNLTEEEVSRLATILQKEYKTEGALRRDITMNIRRLIDVGSYRGSRHKKSLPARGQRTRTNARTRKGPKKTIGAMKRKEAAAKAKPAASASEKPKK